MNSSAEFHPFQVRNKETALLVFSFSAEKESRRKNIFGHQNHYLNTTLFEKLIAKTKEIAFDSGVDVIWMDEHRQRGTDFSSRYTNAYRDLFDSGYENVISIGNDCPDLSATMIRKAVAQLQNKKLVTGPAADGGIYLLGINRSVFDPELFSQLPWQTVDLYDRIITLAGQNNIAYYSLDLLSDLDSSQDLLRYAATHRFTELGRFILEALREKTSCFTYTRSSYFTSHYTPYGLRAPPC